MFSPPNRIVPSCTHTLWTLVTTLYCRIRYNAEYLQCRIPYNAEHPNRHTTPIHGPYFIREQSTDTLRCYLVAREWATLTREMSRQEVEAKSYCIYILKIYIQYIIYCTLYIYIYSIYFNNINCCHDKSRQLKQKLPSERREVWNQKTNNKQVLGCSLRLTCSLSVC